MKYEFNYRIKNIRTFAPLFGIGEGENIDECYDDLLDKLSKTYSLEKDVPELSKKHNPDLIEIYKESATEIK